MIQFNEAECSRIRQRSRQYPETLKKLKETVFQTFQGRIIVPKTGIANWTHYFYCPDCSVSLTFDRNSPESHTCPSCGKTFRGEPYDGAWWGLINAANYNDVYRMAVIWLATGEEAYARKAVDILMEYARCYPDYEVHGNIPYNGPGRSGAQTLDEANFQRTFAMAYDILSGIMTEEEKALVRDNLFLPGAEFLLDHRHRQLHNHEVIINSAIAVIGILFQRNDYVRAALYEDYGIIYQLEKGMLENGMWFEGGFGYHFYALTSFFAFEKFALHTRYSIIHHPNYRKMMELLYDYLEPDYSIPMLNDTNYAHLSSMKNLYEFAYREIGGKKLAFILNTYYLTESRDNLEAFLYGADQIEPVMLPLKNHHTPAGTWGHTILRGKEGRYLLFKHDSYGGEHDHYDRLSISHLACGRAVSPDLGTTGYGAKMHYDYYKNTGTHNTLVIGEENQSPVNARLTRYEETPQGILVEAEADWTAPFRMPDSFTIVQWSEENYRTVTMKRKILWADGFFAEVFLADGIPEGKSADWVMHIKGRLLSHTGEKEALPPDYFAKKPFCYLHDSWREIPSLPASESGSGNPAPEASSFPASAYRRIYRDENVYTAVYGMNNGQDTICAAGPDNPSNTELCYLMERRFSSSILCAHVIESWTDQPVIRDVSFYIKENQIRIQVVRQDGSTEECRFSR